MKIRAFTYALICSLIFFFGILLVIGILRLEVHKENKNSYHKDGTTNQTQEIIDFRKCITRNLSKIQTGTTINCNDINKDNTETITLPSQTKKTITYIYNTLRLIIISQLSDKILINIIYALLFICSLTQTYILLLSIFSGKPLKEYYFYLSDWAINSAPLLGVLGTIASFAALVAGSQYEAMKNLFSSSFFDAAITTIVGGFTYIANLMMAVKINTSIEK